MTPLALHPVGPDLAVVPVRSPTLPPATHTNAWVLGDRQVVVVDPASPWPDQQQGLVDALGEREVRAVFLTHHHLDHVSGAADLVARTGAELWAHRETAARIGLAVDRLVEHGEDLVLGAHHWTALHTPGHAPGHLCLHRAHDGRVVAGDMVAGVGTILLDPPEGVLAEYLASLALLLDLAPRALLPAHGPVIDPAPALLADYIAHRHQRTDQVRRGLAAGPASALALVPGIYPELPAAFHPVAARQLLCHLHWLQARGEVQPLDGASAGAQDPWALASSPDTQ